MTDNINNSFGNAHEIMNKLLLQREEIKKKEEELRLEIELIEKKILETTKRKEQLLEELKNNEESLKISFTSEDKVEFPRKKTEQLLRYIDNLLSELPEQAILDFAKSEEFVIYKEFFSILNID